MVSYFEVYTVVETLSYHSDWTATGDAKSRSRWRACVRACVCRTCDGCFLLTADSHPFPQCHLGGRRVLERYASPVVVPPRARTRVSVKSNPLSTAQSHSPEAVKRQGLTPPSRQIARGPPTAKPYILLSFSFFRRILKAKKEQKSHPRI